MPIANCVISPDLHFKIESTPTEPSINLVQLWAELARQSAEHMTLNVIPAAQQMGNPYAVLANLYLPSMWSEESVASLQLGLSEALVSYFELQINDVIVITSIVQPGLVVDDGKVLHW